MVIIPIQDKEIIGCLLMISINSIIFYYTQMVAYYQANLPLDLFLLCHLAVDFLSTYLKRRGLGL